MMSTFLKNFVADESGASAAEYALILAIVGVGIAGAAVYLRNQIKASIERAGDEVKNSATANASK
jgi:pilus assembly protein Flp/PilA